MLDGDALTRVAAEYLQSKGYQLTPENMTRAHALFSQQQAADNYGLISTTPTGLQYVQSMQSTRAPEGIEVSHLPAPGNEDYLNKMVESAPPALSNAQPQARPQQQASAPPQTNAQPQPTPQALAEAQPQPRPQTPAQTLVDAQPQPRPVPATQLSSQLDAQLQAMIDDSQPTPAHTTIGLPGDTLEDEPFIKIGGNVVDNAFGGLGRDMGQQITQAIQAARNNPNAVITVTGHGPNGQNTAANIRTQMVSQGVDMKRIRVRKSDGNEGSSKATITVQ